MRGFVVVGLSHKTAPLAVRERFALDAGELPQALEALREAAALRGVVATSTCNRFEVYATSDDPERALEGVTDWLRQRAREQALSAVDPYLYKLSGDPAVRHLFRVAASLDSMVVGEAQILGQVKTAYRTAQRLGVVDSTLSVCLRRALRVARQVRRQTEIARHPVSVPQVSVELAAKVFGDLTGRSVLLVGAGKVSEVAAQSLASRGVARTLVANRSSQRARELAGRLDAEPYGLEDLPELLAEVDIIIASTAAKDFVIEPEAVKRAMPRRRYRPLFIIDIAVPRDVDPRVGQIGNVYLFDIDDLQSVVASNLGARHREAREGERIVREQADRFAQELRTDRVTPTLVALREKLTAMKEEETARALAGLNGLGEHERERIERLANTLVNRILHEPTVALKALGREASAGEAVHLVNRLFGLSDEADGVGGGADRGEETREDDKRG